VTQEPPRQPAPTTNPPKPTPTPKPTADPSVQLSNVEQALVDATNRARVRAGCQELRVDSRLVSAARGHSVDMHERGFYSHINPDGQTPTDRAAAEGYEARVGENIAFGLVSADLVINTWSTLHDEKSKMLDCKFTAIGVGADFGLLSSWWTQMLGTD
jgi:uncharacterized protein YkwD